MILQGILEKALQVGINWSSLLVAIRKSDGDLIYEDYKIGLNPQICSDLFPLPNIESASHELARIKCFAKIYCKSAYNQIEIDEKFKEITTINTLEAYLGGLFWHLTNNLSHIFQKTREKEFIRKDKKYHNISG